MDVWNNYVGKKIFLRTKYNRVYSGKVISVDDKTPPLVFLSLIDIKGNTITIVHSEIVEIKEEV